MLIHFYKQDGVTNDVTIDFSKISHVGPVYPVEGTDQNFTCFDIFIGGRKASINFPDTDKMDVAKVREAVQRVLTGVKEPGIPENLGSITLLDLAELKTVSVFFDTDTNGWSFQLQFPGKEYYSIRCPFKRTSEGYDRSFLLQQNFLAYAREGVANYFFTMLTLEVPEFYIPDDITPDDFNVPVADDYPFDVPNLLCKKFAAVLKEYLETAYSDAVVNSGKFAKLSREASIFEAGKAAGLNMVISLLNIFPLAFPNQETPNDGTGK